MIRAPRLILCGILATGLSAASGCGGSTTDSGGSGGGGASTGGSGGSGGSATGGSGGATPSGPCAGSAKQTACKQCCDSKNAGGSTQLFALTAACVCTPDTCQAACKASICASPPAAFNAACTSCYNAVSAASGAGHDCLVAVTSKCDAKAACHAYTKCIEDSGCLDKP